MFPTNSHLNIEWKPYMVKQRFYSGDVKDYLNPGEIVEIATFQGNLGDRIKVRGQEHHANGTIKAGTRKNFLVPLDMAQVATAAPAKSVIDRALEAKKTSTKLLPEGWAEMHWKHKVDFIAKSNDLAILNNIAASDSRNVKSAAEARIAALQRGALAGEAPKVEAPAPTTPSEGLPPDGTGSTGG